MPVKHRQDCFFVARRQGSSFDPDAVGGIEADQAAGDLFEDCGQPMRKPGLC